MSADVLAWGWRYAMVDPAEFRIDYVINPFMDPAVQPDPGRARAQWEALAATLRRLGAEVQEIPALPGAPDMVYAMNLGLALHRPDSTGGTRPVVVMSHMRHVQRRGETAAARAWYAVQGFTTAYVGRDGVGAHFEAGDAFPFGGDLVVGHGPRTDELALKQLATELGVRVRGVRITHPGMYHLDLAFCPLDAERAIVCPAAFDDASALLAHVPEPIVITEEDAITTRCANAVVIGRTVVMPACPTRLRRRLDRLGFDVELVEVDEFHLGGGSVRCLTNPLDIVVGRDLDVVPGGRLIES